MRAVSGLRCYRWRSRKRGTAVVDEIVGYRPANSGRNKSSLRALAGSLLRSAREYSADKLTKTAVVFLMDPRALGCAVSLDVGSDCRTIGIAEGITVDDANEARQQCLGECGDNNPRSENARKRSYHLRSGEVYHSRI